MFVRKTLPEAVVLSTILQDDDELALSLPEGVWVLAGAITFDGAGAGDISLTLSAPLAVSLRWSLHSEWVAGGGFAESVRRTSDETVLLNAAGVGIEHVAHVVGLVEVSALGETLRVRWAQRASNATPTTVHADSWLLAQQVG